MQIKGYELIKKERLEDIGADGYLYKHIKSGATLAVVHNEDTNKVFDITFRTPIYNNTGVPHILEHSVLCGSKKYPVKDPFVELVKGSLNTFLNAMTYPDKTSYPVASYNDKDFANLCDVYMDSVFNPNIYEHEEIFLQEGWTYEMTGKDAPLTINGVVYNEMKGAFSDPDSVVSSEIERNLYPDTTYGYESGGDPDFIPELTYEDFIAFHKKYYHPSNSYIYFYGNIDIEERLTWIDKEYLSKYDAMEIDSEIRWQEPLEAPVEKWMEYPIAEDEDEENKGFLTYSTLLGSILNVEEYYAFDIIDYVLLNSQSAILKKKLLEAGVARDIYGGSGMYLLQPNFSIKAKEADLSKVDVFNSIIEETLTDIVKNGFDKEALEAAIEITEFNKREADYGMYPKGLMYGLDMLDVWLYDKDRPFDILDYSGAYKKLRDGIHTGLFESLVEKYLLNNVHTVRVYAKPVKGLTAAKDTALQNKLEKIKKNLSEEEIQKIVDKTKALKAYQEAEETEEDMKKIPLLDIEDIDKEPDKLENIERNIGETKVIYHDIPTNKIAYIDVNMQTEFVSDEDLPYVGLITDVVKRMDTEKHSYEELETIVNKNTGGVGVMFAIYVDEVNAGKYKTFVSIKSKALYAKVPQVAEIVNELIMHSKFDDYARLKEIIGQVRSSLENRLSSGSAGAAQRAKSYYSEASAVSDIVAGLDYYRFICRIDDNFDDVKEEVTGKLAKIFKEMATRGNMIVNVTCDEEGYGLFEKAADVMFAEVPAGIKPVYKRNLDIKKKNEGIKTSSQVQYVVKTGNFKNAGYEFTGAMNVLSNLMSYDYLWKKVRVDGGAYGCGLSVVSTGDVTFSSYRDPKLKNTIKVYDETVQFLENFDATKRDMDKLIIGTISNLDTPLTARAKGEKAFTAYLKNQSEDMRKKQRAEILGATAEDIRALAAPIKAVLDMNYLCVMGNEKKIEEEKDVFDIVTGLK